MIFFLVAGEFMLGKNPSSFEENEKITKLNSRIYETGAGSWTALRFSHLCCIDSMLQVLFCFFMLLWVCLLSKHSSVVVK